MKLNFAAIAKAIITLILLTVLPIVGQGYLPSQLQTYLSSQSGINITSIINSVAAIGVALAIFILLKGHVTKASRTYLVVASAWKILLLFIILFILGVGHPETFGLMVIGGKADAGENIVAFDFRLFAVLITLTVALMIVRNVLQFQEAKPKAEIKENAPETLTSTSQKPTETQ